MTPEKDLHRAERVIELQSSLKKLTIDLDRNDITVKNDDHGTARIVAEIVADADWLKRMPAMLNGLTLDVAGGDAGILWLVLNQKLCLQNNVNGDIRIKGGCFYKATVFLPAARDLPVFDKNHLQIAGKVLPVSGDQLVAQVEAASMSEELGVIRAFAESAKVHGTTITGSQLVELIDEVMGDDEIRALRILAQFVARDLDTSHVAEIIREIMGAAAELEAFKLLAPVVAKAQRAELREIASDLDDSVVALRFLATLP